MQDDRDETIRIPGVTPLPEFDREIGEAETLANFGLRVLRFVIQYECTATLRTADLELADHFYPIAVRNLDPTRYSPAMIDRLADARRTIQTALRWRQEDERARQDALQASTQPPGAPTSQPGGKLVPTPHPAPQLPPGGATVDPYAVTTPRRQPTF